MSSRLLRPARVIMVSAVLALAMAALAGCSFEPDENIWEISGGVFGTQYHINVVLTEDRDTLDHLAQGIEETLESVDAAMSTWREDSELSRFNRLEDQSGWVEVSPELFEVLSAAQDVSERSGGAFDITIGPVVNLWGFGPEGRPEKIPPDELLSQRLATVGYRFLELDPERQAIRTTRVQYLDLSGIAKGYGVDAVARYLEGQGVDRYLVEIGGEVRVHGRKPDGSAWRLAVEQPVERQRQVNRVIAMDNHAMATSGDYRNYYESEGQRFSHTIDPQSGRPVDHRLASVTVIMDSTMMADAWATALNVLGYEAANRLALQENLAAYFIVREGEGFRTYHTPAFATYLIE
ncbi:thiamine biosynthesis lipoprotein [Marinobacter daqiaonensis]|uniref:FAD:protein FMN transferase n=1 Tax=Marinobacter daqiaonensis TaxID=650891 RepID=A0A1I6H4T6_9GAMM|nr:FAD:protein FMN transferase [Marinobacter daqiaonensis]SFR49432.1 thiamine biosynthesis lipoprotein [Marinobacter daqiaonensis]